MSRLQKKKSLRDKKKKSSVSAGSREKSTDTPKPSIVKPAAVSGASRPKPEKKSGSDVPAGTPNFIRQAMEFLREVKVELKKVTWPTRQQTTGTTIVVIIFVFIVAAFLGLFDFGLSKLVQVVLT
jgi:preprotein translocase subunit SecE